MADSISFKGLYATQYKNHLNCYHPKTTVHTAIDAAKLILKQLIFYTIDTIR